MSSIADAFARCTADSRAALIPYFMAGYPSEATFCRLVKSSFDNGADIVEVGIPFSDPVADGPAIQVAGQIALEAGMTIGRVFRLLASLGLTSSQPVAIMSYLNPILQFGLDRFMAEAAKVGVRGLIIPDLVFEEGETVESACRAAGIDLVYLVAPTSPPNRVQAITQRSRGFVYAVSVLGVTGVRSAFPENLLSRLGDLKKVSPVPVVVGFGIGTPEAAARAAGVADGVVVGSALIEQIKSHSLEEDQVWSVTDLLCQIRDAIKVKSTATDITRCQS